MEVSDVVAAASFCPKAFIKLPFRVISWSIIFPPLRLRWFLVFTRPSTGIFSIHPSLIRSKAESDPKVCVDSGNTIKRHHWRKVN